MHVLTFSLLLRLNFCVAVYVCSPLPQAADTAYYVRVTAHNDIGLGDSLLAGHSSTFDTAPGEAQNVFVEALSDVQLVVNWEAPSQTLLGFGGDGGSAITNYVIEWAETSTGTCQSTACSFTKIQRFF